MSNEQPTDWVPEIVYEEAESGLTSRIPFINVPPGEEMPRLLFVFESRETGEFEPGPKGEDLPVTEIDLYQYANMNYLKSRMSLIEYDNLRYSLGLEPMKTAAVKGQKISSNVRVATEGQHINALDNPRESIKD